MDVLHEHNYFNPYNFILKKKIFQCHICPVVFKHQGSLYTHLKRVHKVRKFGTSNIKCREEKCGERFNKLAELEAHLFRKHMIKIEKQKLYFGSLDEFKTWKAELEKEIESEYVNYTPGSRSSTLYFKCSRSGVYKEKLSQSTRKRKLKAQGSKKLDAHCISRMVVRINDSNEAITVIFCKTHYGHNVELAHLNINQTEKDKIAESLMQGLSADAILDRIRNSVTNNKVERIHLLTKKDIRNIEKSYGVNVAVERHKSELFSVNTSIKELEAPGQSPVIVQKNECEMDIGFNIEIL